MLKFDDLIVPVEKTIKIRGVDRPIRFVSAVDHAAIEEAFPWPEPPLAPDKTKGSLAPPVKDYESPEYLAGCKVVEFRRLAAHAAVGLRYKTRDGLDWEASKATSGSVEYLRTASDELAALLAGYELQHIRNELMAFTIYELAAASLGN